MVITYDSLTGQSKRFATKISEQVYDINQYVPDTNDHVLLVTRTFKFGEIPESTKQFLERFSKHVVAVCVSGNKNWGANYGAAGDKIQTLYGIPLIRKFEASGFASDVKAVQDWIHTFKQRRGEQ